MKKIIVISLVIIIFSFNVFAENSPILKGLIFTNPSIPFEFSTNIDENIILNPIYELFGTNIANQFQIWEALILDVQEDWERVEFKFMQEFTEQDTVIAIFNNEEEIVILFLEYENGVFPVDFTLVPNGYNTMYIISDYEG